jgi:zinc protease
MLLSLFGLTRLALVRILICSAVLLWGLAGSVQAQVYRYQLDNGLTLLVEPDHRSPVALFQISYKVGARFEPSGITGISHMLEHMMFQGTKTLGAGEWSKMVAREGGQDNAATRANDTRYYQLWSSKNMPLSFKYEADRMRHLRLKESDFQQEKKVVQEERRLRVEDRPESLAYEQMSAVVYDAVSLDQPVIGWMEDIEAYRLDQLKQWYEAWYHPNNAIIVVVGHVDPDAMYTLAKKYFGSIPARTVPYQPTSKHSPTQGYTFLEMKNRVAQPSLWLSFKVPSLKTIQDPQEAYALEALVSLLDGSAAALLETQLVREKKVAVSAHAYYDLYSPSDTVLGILATPAIPSETLQDSDKKDKIAQDALDKLHQSIQTILDEIKNTKPNIQDLEPVIQQQIAQSVYRMDSLTERSNLMISLWVAGLDPELYRSYPDALKKVTPEQIQAVAKKYLVRERLVETRLLPQ